MLASLNIGQWGNRRLDRKVMSEVNKAHGAKDAGRFSKHLIDEAAFADLNKIESDARSMHYAMTSPWGDAGERILPSMLFMEYAEAMDKFKREFERGVKNLHVEYPKYVQEARVKLGTLYDPKDYPSDVREKFYFKVRFMPLATANDFRVNLSEAHVMQIRQDIAAAFDARMAEATEHLVQRVREVATNIAETCSRDKPRIFGSMMEKAEQLVEVIPALNLTNDPKLTWARDRLKDLLTPTSLLRNSPAARSTAAARAQQLLAGLP